MLGLGRPPPAQQQSPQPRNNLQITPDAREKAALTPGFLVRPGWIGRGQECLLICPLGQPQAVQLPELLEGDVLGRREPGVALDEGVGVVADLEGDQGEDFVDQGGGEGSVEEAEPRLDERRGCIGGEEVREPGITFQLRGQAPEGARHPLAILEAAFVRQCL